MGGGGGRAARAAAIEGGIGGGGIVIGGVAPGGGTTQSGSNRSRLRSLSGPSFFFSSCFDRKISSRRARRSAAPEHELARRLRARSDLLHDGGDRRDQALGEQRRLRVPAHRLAVELRLRQTPGGDASARSPRRPAFRGGPAASGRPPLDVERRVVALVPLFDPQQADASRPGRTRMSNPAPLPSGAARRFRVSPAARIERPATWCFSRCCGRRFISLCSQPPTSGA